MLKTVSSVANALGALNYKGTWNATTNTPTLASGVGTQGDYYVVSVAGATDLDGITNWGVGDWAAFNGSVWQRVEGGADGNFVNLTASGTATITGLSSLNGGLIVNTPDSAEIIGVAGDSLTLTAKSGDATAANNAGGGFRNIGSATATVRSAQMWLDADGANLSGGDYFYMEKKGNSGDLILSQYSNANMIFRTNGDVEAARFTSTGNLAFPSGQGIDFSATAQAPGMTSELLSDYEEGTWTVNYAPTTGAFTTITTVGTGRYTKIGRLVTVFGALYTSGALDVTGASGNLKITGLPYACNATLGGGGADISHQSWNLGPDILNTRMSVAAGASEILMGKNTMNGSSFPSGNITVADMSTSGGAFSNLITFTASYEV
jgi:hypothetical protein